VQPHRTACSGRLARDGPEVRCGRETGPLLGGATCNVLKLTNLCVQ
jgi:hypothetical protein